LKTPRRISLEAKVILALLGFSFCASGPFWGQHEVTAFFTAHRQEYESIAETWARKPPGSIFGYFGLRSYRWNDAFIDGEEGDYKVEGINVGRTTLPTLSEAAKVVGTTEEELNHWISEALHDRQRSERCPDFLRGFRTGLRWSSVRRPWD
jgi:hypothetical protein